MLDENVLEGVYLESLEEDVIGRISMMKNITLEDAMDAYYRSNLAVKIQNGSYGIQYLDYKNLADILMTTEANLFQ